MVEIRLDDDDDDDCAGEIKRHGGGVDNSHEG